MGRLRDLIRRFNPLQGGEYEDVRRGVNNTDAMAADGGRARNDGQTGGSFNPAVPPNYIKTYDEGRPRQ